MLESGVARKLAVCGVWILGLAAAGPAVAQTVIGYHEDLDFDRPESWAMAWFSSVGTLSPLAAPSEARRGAVALSVEGGWIPTLDDRQRTVGFIGTKPENLNRSSALGRLRVEFGLPARSTLTVGYIPPVELDGIEPHLVALAFRRPIGTAGRWRFGGGLIAGWGQYRGDITCDHDSVAGGDDLDRNPYRCAEPSNDTMESLSGGLELVAGWNGFEERGFAPYAGLLAQHLENRFDVDARYGGVIDHTRLEASGETWAVVAGAAALPSEKLRWAVEAFYSPLRVVRPPDRTAETDALFHLRVLAGWTLR